MSKQRNQDEPSASEATDAVSLHSQETLTSLWTWQPQGRPWLQWSVPGGHQRFAQVASSFRVSRGEESVRYVAWLTPLLSRLFTVYNRLYVLSPLMFVETLSPPPIRVEKLRHREVKQVAHSKQGAKLTVT